MKATRSFSLALLLALPACGGGGSGAAATPGSGGGGQSTQSNYVTPTFIFAFPSSTSSSSSSRAPQFLGANSLGVVITLVSSTAGPSNLTATTDLTAAGVCVAGPPKTCTVNGPPVPPGTDVFNVQTYKMEPTGTPLAEPAGAKVDATSVSTATPPQSNPSFTIVAGTSSTETVTLFGVPAGFISTAPLNGTPNIAFATPSNFGVTVTDAAGDAITGEFAAPITVTDTDATGAGSQGTQISVGGNAAGPTQTLNNPTDASGLAVNYGGLAEQSHLITFSSGGGQIGTRLFSVAPATLTLTPSEVDLYNPIAGQAGNSGTFVASEPGLTNSPYDRTLTVTPATCLNGGTASKIYSLNRTLGTSFADTVPPGPTAGSCTVSVGPDLQLDTATETLTYTTGNIVVNGRARSH